MAAIKGKNTKPEMLARKLLIHTAKIKKRGCLKCKMKAVRIA
jgi:hypothetical protein